MPCEYCDADVAGGCRGAASAADCLREQLATLRAEVQRVRETSNRRKADLYKASRWAEEAYAEADKLRKAQARSVDMFARAKWAQIGRVDEGNAVTLMFASAADARPVYQAFSDIQDWKGAAEGVDPDVLWDRVCAAEGPAQKPPLYVVHSDVPPGPEAQAHIERIVSAVSRQMKPGDLA